MAEKRCNNCSDKSKPADVTYAVFESTMTRQHIISKRLIAVIILLIVLLVGSNCAWLWYESQFEIVTETYEVEQDTDIGNNNCIVKGGEINNGTSEN